MMQSSTSSTLMDRLMGVATLKAPVYKSIAKDTSATSSAATVVIIAAIINGILGAISAVVLNSVTAQLGSQGGIAIPTLSPIGGLIRGVITTLLGWLVGSAVLAFVAKTLFQGKTDTQEMMRVTGFTSVFSIIGSILALIPIIGALGALVAVVLQGIGNVIGIREAAEIDTTKSVVTAIIAIIVIFVIGLVLGAIIR